MPAQPQQDRPDLRGLTLLVVDDDEDTIEVLSIYLRACGAEVLVAHTAQDGLVSVDAAPRLDAVITDLSMPHMDGVEFLRNIRRHPSPSRRRVPVVVLTAFEAGYMPTQGFDAYLRKPVEPDALCRTIDSVIARRRSS
jgi:diguanylate cyclase